MRAMNSSREIFNKHIPRSMNSLLRIVSEEGAWTLVCAWECESERVAQTGIQAAFQFPRRSPAQKSACSYSRSTPS